MHIETALNISSPSPKRQASQIHIHKGLAYLRASSKHWESVRSTLRMLEEIVNKTGLALDGLSHHKFDLSSMSPFSEKQNGILEARTESGGKMAGASIVVTGDRSFLNDPGHPRTTFPSPIRSHLDSFNLTYETMVADDDPEKWLNELLAENVLGMDSTQSWGELVGS